MTDETIAPGLCTNQPHGGPSHAHPFELPPQMARALADSALTWPPGKELLVRFLNANDAWTRTIRAAVERIAPQWSDYANLRFRFTDGDQAHITINLLSGSGAGYGTYSCYLGIDCRSVVAQRQPAMNLVFHPSLQANPDFMESEFRRVILHEFGHALGFPHEHMRPDRPIKWNLPALYAYCARDFGWGPRIVDEQIVQEYQPRAGADKLIAGAFDPKSIMMYEYPKGIATYADGSPFESPNNAALTPMDKVVAAMAYPSGVAESPEVEIDPGHPAYEGSIDTPGQVARYRFTATESGDHAVETTGDTPLLVSLLTDRNHPNGRVLAAEGAPIALTFHPLQAGQVYLIDVRHARPMVGKGPFAIRVRPPSGIRAESPTPTPTSPVAKADPLAGLGRGLAV